MRNIRYYFISILFCSNICGAQNMAFFQGGESTANDNWGFATIMNAGGPLPPGAVAVLPRTGSHSIRAGGGNNTGCSGGTNCIVGGQATGCPMHGNTITFNIVDISCMSNVVLTVYHRSHTFCSGSGFDAGEGLNFFVSLNGGPFTSIGNFTAGGDYTWTYSTNPVGSGPTVSNPIVYNVPPGTNTISFRVVGTLNRSDEVYYLDDVSLTTSTVVPYPDPNPCNTLNAIILNFDGFFL